MSRKRLIIIIIVAVVIIGAAVVLWASLRSRSNIEIVRPIRRDVVEFVIASGNLQAVRTSDIGTEVAGIVARVLVQEGDEITAGQTLIVLDRAAAEQRVQQARLAVQTAQSQLEQVQAGAPAEQIARARAELAQARRVNAARLEQAQQRLRQLEVGGRPEERRRAEAALRQAQANLEQAQTDLRRAELLFQRGAIPRADLDRARTQVQVAQAQVNSAEEALAVAQQPARPEDIAAARAEVRAAQATLEESVRIAQEQLRELQSQPRLEEVRVAGSRLSEAQSALQEAELQLAKRTIRAPFSGLITERNVEPGQSVTPGQTLLVLADMSRTEVVVETDESNLPKLDVGQPAILIPPAFSDQPFRGALSEIGPEVDPERGVVLLTIRPLYLPDYARPDLTVDANIEVRRIDDALSLPVSSLLQEGGQTYVLVVRDGEAARQDVRVLARGERFAAVSGLSPNARVVASATTVRPGQRVGSVGGT